MRRSRRRSQWQAGIQKTLPWASSSTSPTSATTATTVSARSRAARSVNLNAIDFGAAYLPQNQDLTQGAQRRSPARRAARRTCCGRTAGFSNINQNTTEFHDTYHSIQTNFNRRFRNGFASASTTSLSLSFTGNTGLKQRLQHDADGTFSIRADQAAVREAATSS